MKFRSVMVKLRNTILVFLLLFIVAILLVLSVYYRNIVLDNTKSQIRKNDEILAKSIENSIQNTESYCNTMIIQLNESLKDKLTIDGYPLVDTQTQKKIYKSMINTFTMFRDAQQVMVVWNNGIGYYQNRTENYSMNIGEMKLLSELKNKEINRFGRWLTGIDTECKIQGEGLYFVKAYADIESGKLTGYIVIKINDMLNILNAEETGRKFYLFDQNGQLIQSSDTAAGSMIELTQSGTPPAELSSRILQKDAYSNEMELYNHWKLYSVTDMKGITGELNQTILLLAFISTLIMGLLFLILNYIVKRIVMPIRTLSEHMISFENELPSKLEFHKTNDEIGVLVSHFNVMASKNRELFELILEKNEQQKKLEFALLQSQIKPHFLYNTLDTIYCLNELGRSAEASIVTKQLSDYYRGVLSRGTDWVLLSDEVALVEKYLEILSIRYRNVLGYTIEFDEHVEMIKIPKLTLQPLVENAIYHGIKSSNRKGNLCIRITQKQQIIEIRVIDDGVGFSKEHFEKVLRNGKDSEHGFGLRNVKDRLQLHFGDHCEFILEDTQTGTSILIKICVEPEEV